MVGPNYACLSARGQDGASSVGHLLDISLLGMAISAATTPLVEPDYMMWSITVFGALLGGLIGARMFRSDGETLYTQWFVSTCAGIVFAPMIFELLTQPGWVVNAAVIPTSANALMGVSAAVAVFSWAVLRFVDRAWRRIASRWLDQQLRDRADARKDEP